MLSSQLFIQTCKIYDRTYKKNNQKVFIDLKLKVRKKTYKGQKHSKHFAQAFKMCQIKNYQFDQGIFYTCIQGVPAIWTQLQQRFSNFSIDISKKDYLGLQ